MQRFTNGELDDTSLFALYYNFGRYLLIASSAQKATLPANLQGIWCSGTRPSWGSDYHTNINLQMNYWPAHNANMAETFKPFVHFMKMISRFGEKTAKELFFSKGWTINHTTDIFGRTGIHDFVQCGFFPLAGSWLCMNLWEHYEYTNDIGYLNDIYPILKGAVEFVSGFLVEDKDGRLVTSPSNSPENEYYYVDENGEKRKEMFTYGATVDFEIIFALFTRVRHACQILGKDEEMVKNIDNILSRIPPLRVSEQYGTICEWIQDYEEVDPGHRHISHLFGLFPSDQINETDTAVYEAAKNTINRRILHGGAGTGWARAWVVNFYARLKDGEQAMYHLNHLMGGSTGGNLLDLYPMSLHNINLPDIFQIDGNFGAVSGITEMLILMKEDNHNNLCKSEKGVSIENYRCAVRTDENGVNIWSDAFQKAINENAHIIIPSSSEPYYIDKTIVVPSNRYIEAHDGAVICQMEGVKTLLLRNKNNEDGTHTKETFKNPDTNIFISGGCWKEQRIKREGYGLSGMYDEERSYFGVSTCMFFNNIKNLTVENVVFSNTGGFGIQVGNAQNIVFENLEFENCFADGIHITGNIENIYISNVSGKVGDDLVAFNMYDWKNSSVDFGSIKTVWCENIHLHKESPYKAFRIQPGIYFYDDETQVDCSLNDAVIKNVRGIKTFKLYFQTPCYKLHKEREVGETGTGDNIYFEDILIDLDSPIDMIENYVNSDPVTGSIAGFEIGANIKNLYFENINVTLYKDKYPMSFFACVGPKSARFDGREIFDPEISSTVDNIYLKNVSVNSGNTQNSKEYIHQIDFDDIYKDGTATGKGVIKNIVIQED